MSFVHHSYVLVCHPYVTFMSLVCTRMSSDDKKIITNTIRYMMRKNGSGMPAKLLKNEKGTVKKVGIRGRPSTTDIRSKEI